MMKAGVATCSFGGVREQAKLINTSYQQGFHGFSVFRLLRTCVGGGEQGAAHNSSSSLASFVCFLCFMWFVVWVSSGLAKRFPRLLWYARGGLTGWCCCVFSGVVVEAVCFRVELGPECRFVCFYVFMCVVGLGFDGFGEAFPSAVTVRKRRLRWRCCAFAGAVIEAHPLLVKTVVNRVSVCVLFMFYMIGGSGIVGPGVCLSSCGTQEEAFHWRCCAFAGVAVEVIYMYVLW